MNYAKKFTLFTIAAMTLSACGSESAEPDVGSVDKAQASAAKPLPESNARFVSTTKPGSPYYIGYRVIGTPIVGSPLTLELEVKSTLGFEAVNLAYRINDATAMTLTDAQPRAVRVPMTADAGAVRQQVSIVPLREGRLFLNVEASFATESGAESTVIAIPVQVGGMREVEVQGRVERDDDGELVRVLEQD